MRPHHHAVSEYVSWALDADAEVQSVSSLAGGIHDNYFVQAHIKGVPSRFVVRRMPSAAAFGFARNEVVPYSLQAEFNALKDLENISLRTPKVWGLDHEGKFLGTPVFLMEYIEGPTILDAIPSNPETVLQKFAATILAMNQISAAKVPSVAASSTDSGEQPARRLLDWLIAQAQNAGVPSFFNHGLELLEKELSDNGPSLAFGNGDLNPQNFICADDGQVAVVDWEYAGFNDPLVELMLLHTWPEHDPFLNTYPLDRLYCEMAGLDVSLLRWYEVYSALSGWIFAEKDQSPAALALHEQRATALLS